MRRQRPKRWRAASTQVLAVTVAPRNDTRRDGVVGTSTRQGISSSAHSGRFVLDFAAPKCLLAIEVDGSIHAGRELEDEERQRILESQGWRFLRFPNAEIQDNLSAVLAQIEATLQPPHCSYPE